MQPPTCAACLAVPNEWSLEARCWSGAHLTRRLGKEVSADQLIQTVWLCNYPSVVPVFCATVVTNQSREEAGKDSWQSQPSWILRCNGKECM